MGVRLRLARFGRKNLESYRIYAANSKSPRNGKHLEILGYYDPNPGRDGTRRIGIKSERVKYWLSNGAQPTDTVAMILGRVGLLPMPPRPKLMKKTEAAKVVAEMKATEKAAAAAAEGEKKE